MTATTKTKANRPKRIGAGNYEWNGWTIQTTEGEQNCPGYRWIAEHDSYRIIYANTKREILKILKSIESYV